MKWFLGWCKWLWHCLFGVDKPVVRVSLSRYAKNRMMRECGLSSRQWVKFRKRKQREAKEEMRNAIRSAG